jgi:hypothetical protein
MIVLLRGLLMAALVGLWVWSVIDVIRTDAERMQYLHKLIWLALVLLFVPIGAIAWIVIGRPERMGARLFPQERSPMPPPDDSPEFLRQVDDEIRRRRRADQMRSPDPSPPVDDDAVNDEIRRLEEEFRRQADEDGPGTSPS